MRNPWLDLPSSTPLTLASDAALLQAFNLGAAKVNQYDLSLFPEPFFGSPIAPVVILNLNPGLSPGDAAVHAQPGFAAMSRHSLAHSLSPYPFLHLQPTNVTPGEQWWHRRTRELVSEVGFEAVASGLSCVQYMPYHSQRFATSSPRLPSQAFSFHLVRQAMARQAEIVVMRSRKLWFSAVPELASYERLHFGTAPRSPYISPGNLKSSYLAIARRLRSAASDVEIVDYH